MMILLQHLSASQYVVNVTYQSFANLAGKWVCSVTSLLIQKVHIEGSMQPVMTHILQTAALYRRHLLKCTQHWLLYVCTHWYIHSLSCSWLHTISHLWGWHFLEKHHVSQIMHTQSMFSAGWSQQGWSADLLWLAGITFSESSCRLSSHSRINIDIFIKNREKLKAK